MKARGGKQAVFEDQRSRMKSYQNRKKSLLKKVQELTTLCDVPTCMIIYGPQFNNNLKPEIDVWPKQPKDFIKVVNMYQNTPISKIKPHTSMVNFYGDRKKKVDAKIAKLRNANLKAKFPSHYWDDRLDHFSVDQLKSLVATFDMNIDVATTKIHNLIMSKKVNQQCTLMIEDGSKYGHQFLGSSSSSSNYPPDHNQHQNQNQKALHQMNHPIFDLNTSDDLDRDSMNYMKVMNGGHHLVSTQHGLGGGGCNVSYSTSMQQYPNHFEFDPMAAVMNNAMMMNKFYGAAAKQQLPPAPYNYKQCHDLLSNVSSSAQVHGSNSSQFNHQYQMYHDINGQFGMLRKKNIYWA